ncbi:hypothetical protein [Mobilicoccus sp.]|uniref:hypothetical protein n=1 Tax=Mobilicoccus sp. TaxID=2034349 RepID=UPI0028ABD4A2|nr:hypothetical protein [Mobilicoccus sp.]
MNATPGIDRYALDYGWGHEPGWTDETEITLLGVIQGEAATTAVREWVASLPESELPRERGRHYHGGATMEIVEDGPSGMGLALRSVGEDAFDSVAWYADVVADLVTEPGDPATTLTWTQLPFGAKP